MNIHFNFFGISVVLSSNQPESYEFFRLSHQSFAFFVDPKPMVGTPDIHIQYVEKLVPQGIKLFSFRDAVAYGWQERFVRYPENHLVRIKTSSAKQLIQISGSKKEWLQEMVFTLINSQVGWELEKRGWIRLHAASFLKHGVVQTIFGDSGFGKSTLTARELKGGASIWSDEITLINPSGEICPWPVPIQLSQHSIELLNLDIKTFLPFPKRRHPTKYQLPIPLESAASPHAFEGLQTSLGLFPVIWRVLVGYGLPQILEFNLRLDMLPILIRCLVVRAVFVSHWTVGLVKNLKLLKRRFEF